GVVAPSRYCTAADRAASRSGCSSGSGYRSAMSAAASRRRSICSGVSSSAAGPSQAIRSSLGFIGLLLAVVEIRAAAVQAGQGLAADAAGETVTLGGAVRLGGVVDGHLAQIGRAHV